MSNAMVWIGTVLFFGGLIGMLGWWMLPVAVGFILVACS